LPLSFGISADNVDGSAVGSIVTCDAVVDVWD